MNVRMQKDSYRRNKIKLIVYYFTNITTVNIQALDRTRHKSSQNNKEDAPCITIVYAFSIVTYNDAKTDMQTNIRYGSFYGFTFALPMWLRYINKSNQY